MEAWKEQRADQVRCRGAAYWTVERDRGTRCQRVQRLKNNRIDLIFGWEHRCAGWRHIKHL